MFGVVMICELLTRVDLAIKAPPLLRELGAGRNVLQRDGEVDQVEVEVFEAPEVERVFAGLLNLAANISMLDPEREPVERFAYVLLGVVSVPQLQVPMLSVSSGQSENLRTNLRGDPFVSGQKVARVNADISTHRHPRASRDHP